MALDVTPIYRNLRTRVTFFGLEAEDLFAILAVAVVMNICGRLARLAWLYLYQPENKGFHLGLSCGFVFCGVLGFLMRWVFSPKRGK